MTSRGDRPKDPVTGAYSPEQIQVLKENIAAAQEYSELSRWQATVEAMQNWILKSHHVDSCCHRFRPHTCDCGRAELVGHVGSVRAKLNERENK